MNLGMELRKVTKAAIEKSELPSELKSALISDKDIVLYGAGWQALLFLDFLVTINKNVICALVTDKSTMGEVRFERKKIPVFSIDEFCEKYKNGGGCCVVAALNEQLYEEIRCNLQQRDIYDMCMPPDWKHVNKQLPKIVKNIHVFMFENELISNPRFGVFSRITKENGSFKNYMLENNMPEKIARLKKNLDADSINVIDRCLFNMLQTPEDWLCERFWFLSIPEYENVFMTDEDRKRVRKCFENSEKHKHRFLVDRLDYPPYASPFLFHHGLFLADGWVKDYVRGKDFFDCGAFDASSALIFEAFYEPKKTYSFELSPKNCLLYEENMRAHDISPERYELVNCGISDISGTCYVSDKGGDGVSLSRFASQEETTGSRVPLVSIDDFVESRDDIQVGLIKGDLEGHALKAIVGMEKTLKRFRPVLSMAIYHCPEEFFEVKPLVEEYMKDLNYHISIVLNFANTYEMAGVTLFCYPNQ